MLENAAKGMQKHDTAITSPCPSLPTSAAICPENRMITIQMTSDIIRFDQKATVVDLYRSSLVSNLCCMRYF